ncbi:MAG: PEP-CTERM sorting domain-containing protein, partial [Chthoniobacterales bacterium]
NDDTYNTAGDPSSGVLYAARLASFTYIGHAADGTSANFGLAPGINGDCNANGSVTATFHGLTPGNYSFFVGGASYAAQTAEPGPIFPTYGVNVTVRAVPEPSAYALLAAGGAVLAVFLRRRAR